MISGVRRAGINLIEVLVVIAILGVVAALLLPALQASREVARLGTCTANMRVVGLAMNEYLLATRHFPPAATLMGVSNPKTVGGWSFLVRLLPYLNQNKLYDTLDIKGNNPFDGSPSTATADKTLINHFLCPSSRTGFFKDELKRVGALTSFKAMGATTKEGLNMALTNLGAMGEPPMPHISQPDGAIYPGSTTNLESFGSAGATHTILCVETIDNTASRWLVGGDITLVGLPTGTKTGAVSFAVNGVWGDYAAPDGFSGKFDSQGHATATSGRYAHFLTYLNSLFYNPTSTGANVYGNTDSGSPVINNASEKLGDPRFGPSSAHPGVVNHLFVDGSVHSISENIDVATYMFLITRDNDGPTSHFFK